MVSFIILSCLVLPLIQHNILISATLTWLSCWLLAAQHSVPYNTAGLTCPTELSFQLKWYFLIAQNTRDSSPFQPPNLDTMIYICFYFSTI